MIVRNAKGILTRFYACEYHILNLKRERRDWKSKLRYNLQVEVLQIWKQNNNNNNKKKKNKKKEKKTLENIESLEIWCQNKQKYYTANNQ